MFHNKNIFIALTYRCNAFCKKCMTRYHVNRNIEMSKENLNRFFELLKKNDFKGMISVGTGEPLLYSDIDYFVYNVLNVNDQVKLRLLTNGMLLSENNVSKLFSKRCKWGVTMDAFYQNTLDGLQVGVDIEKVKYNVTSVAKRYGGSQMYLNFTVYNDNIDEMLPFCKFAIKNGVRDVYFTELKIFSGYERELEAHRVVHDEHFKETVLLIKKFLIQNGISTSGINFDNKVQRLKCYESNKASPIIDVDGRVTFCSGREDVFVGNILDDDIEEKWLDYCNRISCLNGKWCDLCFDHMLDNGSYRLPRTIRKEKM